MEKITEQVSLQVYERFMVVGHVLHEYRVYALEMSQKHKMTRYSRSTLKTLSISQGFYGIILGEQILTKLHMKSMLWLFSVSICVL